MTFYIDSGTFTTIPNYHLTKLIVMFGGKISPGLDKSVTHLLCHNLSAARTKSSQRSKTFTKYLRPEFVLDSLKNGQLELEAPYLISGTRTNTLDAHLAKRQRVGAK
eukprot:NODE_3821_length_727_cov_20.927729_g3222_i0.p2 GENE.NODE_3821_length_727_cov_20.927729_g3222_i0~~NODE_3821_length_727_cov_20.927729_g3222_i0.p2  ORF type:complete len:107 (-),score=20.03 NODE_3821_length_727_cov_20.927729_g3222_i0:150-470(-)